MIMSAVLESLLRAFQDLQKVEKRELPCQILRWEASSDHLPLTDEELVLGLKPPFSLSIELRSRMAEARRAEVWLVDLGYAAKVRPCLVLSVPAETADRVLVTLVPHTTSPRRSRFEVPVPVRFLVPDPVPRLLGHTERFESPGTTQVPILMERPAHS